MELENMTTELTSTKVWEEVCETVRDMIHDLPIDCDRETLIERIDEECDSLFGRLVKHGRIDQYDVDDLVNTAGECAAIIKCAESCAWVEDDNGLWDGLTYGVLASIAYFSLRNCLTEACKSEHEVDVNDDQPLIRYHAERMVKDMPRDRVVALLTSVDIDCQDDETDDELRTALAENVIDGTIDASELS